MSTKPKRKYGQVRTGKDASAGTNESVFDKFFTDAPPAETAAPSETIAPAFPEPPAEIQSPVKSTSPPLQKVGAVESLPPAETAPVRGFLKLPNHFIYGLMPSLKPSDGYVLLYLYARTVGFGKTRLVVTLNRIANACHISESQARICVRSLQARSLIRIEKIDRDNPDPLLRGLWIEMLMAPPPPTETKGGAFSAAPAKYQPIKDRSYKRKDIKEPDPDTVEEYERNRAELERGKG